MSKLFAEINSENKVTRVLVIDKGTDKQCKDWLETRLGGTWVKTYSTSGVEAGTEKANTKQPAGVGFTYDPDTKEFIPPQPFESWILNKNLVWEAPVEKPDSENEYRWDEEKTSWVEVIKETE